MYCCLFVSCPSRPGPSQAAGEDDWLTKALVADFFFVLFSLAWFVAGLLASPGGEDTGPVLDAWYFLWPVVWQPAIGVS